ncbi:protegrin-3-like [Pseudophryne corroboree]|uniref:protegrin-3-like n=1 Tax=Pseudophryne corroboree TaxID=495146 RepID=UPI00308200FE
MRLENIVRHWRSHLLQHKMRSCWLSLLLLSAVTLDSGLSQSPELDIQDETRILELVKRFNLQNDVDYLYKPEEGINPEEEGNPRKLKCRIKETVCPRNAKRDLLKCDHQKQGKVQECAVVLAETDADADEITCKPLTLRGGGSMIAGFDPLRDEH